MKRGLKFFLGNFTALTLIGTVIGVWILLSLSNGSYFEELNLVSSITYPLVIAILVALVALFIWLQVWIIRLRIRRFGLRVREVREAHRDEER